MEAILRLTGEATDLKSEAQSSPLTGRWGGVIKFPRYDPVHVRVTFFDEVDQWVGMLDLPRLGATEIPLNKIHFRANQAQFEFSDGKKVLQFRGNVGRKQMQGKISLDGKEYPFLFLRIPSQASES